MIRAGVFIGVDRTGQLHQLHDAAAGARRMYVWALTQGLDPDRARLITDEREPVDAYRVIKTIEGFYQGAGVERVIVYFAGHGANIGGGDPDALAAFIGGAGVRPPEPAESAPPGAPEPRAALEAAPPPYPWAAPGVRDDVAKVFNLRLPEPYLLQLKYIAEHTPDSLQQFCPNALLPAIDAKIEELLDSAHR